MRSRLSRFRFYKLLHWMKIRILGRKVAVQLLRDYPDAHIITTLQGREGNGVGELAIALAYAGTYKKVNNIEKLNVLAVNKNNPIFQYYADEYNELIPISEKEHDLLIAFLRSSSGKKFQNEHKQLLMISAVTFVDPRLFDYTDLSYADIVKAMFKLSENAVPEKPRELASDKFIEDLHKKNILSGNRNILLNPYANHAAGVPMGFFETLSNELSKRGYNVITALNREQIEVPGTTGVPCSLEKVIALSRECMAVIGTRSGFLDLVASWGGVSVMAIYPQNYANAGEYRLDMLWPDALFIEEYHWSLGSEREIINTMVRNLDSIRENSGKEISVNPTITA